MRDMSSGATQDFHLFAVEVNTVCKHDIRGCQPDVVQIFDVPAAGFALDQFNLVPVLGCVSVNHYSTLPRQSADALQQFLGTTYGEPRSEAITYSAFSFPVPALQ